MAVQVISLNRRVWSVGIASALLLSVFLSISRLNLVHAHALIPKHAHISSFIVT